MTKINKKWWSNAIKTFGTLVVSVVTSLLPKTVAEVKIGAITRKFCVVTGGTILFVVFFRTFGEN